MTLLDQSCPAGWRPTTLGDEVDLLTGFPFPSSGYSRAGVRLVRGMNVKRGVLDWSEDITKRWPAITPDVTRYQLRENDIVIAMDGALVGHSYAAMRSTDLPALLLQRVARIRSLSVEQLLLHAWIGSHAFVRHVDERKTHTAVPHVSPEDIRSLPIRVPESRVEQRCISSALCDTDELIVCLERLIAKKRDIKQGAMQQLLTGKRRLPGFDAEWAAQSLGSLGSFMKGRGIKRDDICGQGVPCIRYGEIYTRYSGYADRPVSYVTRAVAATALPIVRGDLLFAGSGETADEIGMCLAYTGSEGAVAGGDIVVLRSRAGHDPVFLASLFNAPVVQKQKTRLGQGDAVVHISSRALASIEVDIPGLDEQQAIGMVIRDMDTEIETLELRLAKTRDIKRGMMQELLTGLTRLPAPDEGSEGPERKDESAKVRAEAMA